jgi:hypothetical protein
MWPGVQLAQQACEYWTDACQRSVLFLSVMRQRGNNYCDRAAEQVPNVLHFQFEPIMSGRDLPRPVNYGLVRTLPPAGVEVDPRKQPFISSFNRTVTHLGDDCRWTTGAQEDVRFPLENGSPAIRHLSGGALDDPDQALVGDRKGADYPRPFQSVLIDIDRDPSLFRVCPLTGDESRSR